MDQQKYPYIYLDLDETLVYTEFCAQYEPKVIPEGAHKFNFGTDQWYYTHLRECTKDLIEFCRNLSITKILTAATTDYVKVINDQFDLGFDEDEIITRYDYCDWVRDGWGGYFGGARETCVAKECVGHINSILIDNQHHMLPNARIKCEWLGISTDRYIEFPEWNGKDEISDLDERIEVIKTKIQFLLDNGIQK